MSNAAVLYRRSLTVYGMDLANFGLSNKYRYLLPFMWAQWDVATIAHKVLVVGALPEVVMYGCTGSTVPPF